MALSIQEKSIANSGKFNKELEPLRDLLYKLQWARKTVEELLDQIDSARYCFDIGLIDIISNLYSKIKQDI